MTCDQAVWLHVPQNSSSDVMDRSDESREAGQTL